MYSRGYLVEWSFLSASRCWHLGRSAARMYLVQRDDTQVPLCNCEGESRMEGATCPDRDSRLSASAVASVCATCVVRHPLRGSDGTNISAANLG
ncbi:hypothetical protein JMJ77_0011319 [Colletotrichum scovillei]|uniref:Uncharacterized protein n=1 Tax=Colletotrichum scovillei TaxID=1209932 RepID=A0A9P7UB65_9PEZI|nr:hypothetical protein JMJ77_0011319 [Colletotrichum scovillei]KAG7060298.1 hypothetical protein JMJ78_0015573 [Colletotrichum scovillei]KAG7067748.1 hypothetical protein JMJ76_0009176 [Colletotrichum scovillei]